MNSSLFSLSVGAVFALSLTSCSFFGNRLVRQPLVLVGPEGREAVLYRIPDASRHETSSFIPHARVMAGAELLLEPGLYFIANECSGYTFQHLTTKPTRIPLSTYSIESKAVSPAPASVDHPATGAPILASTATSATDLSAPGDEVSPGSVPSTGETPAPDGTQGQEAQKVPGANAMSGAIAHAQCIDPVDGHLTTWETKREFDFLPGESSFYLGGKKVAISTTVAQGEKRTMAVSALRLVGPEVAQGARFFIIPSQSADGTNVISASVGSIVWLIDGEYGIEINGSRKKIKLEKDAFLEIPLGVLRVEMPADFPQEERLKAGGQPIFASINEGVFFKMNTDYIVFPGEYNVSLEGSDVSGKFLVEAQKQTLVKTRGAQILLPPCPPASKRCAPAPQITIHKEQRPYPLMHVEPGTPFLVLDGEYQYGVQGTRGLLRDLKTSERAVHKEALSRVRFRWEVRSAASKIRTDLVRFESTGAPTYGKTLDFLFSRPREIYVPSGRFHLTYFVGDPALERKKTRQPLAIGEGETFEVTVPIYSDKVDSQPSASLGDRSESKAGSKEGKVSLPGNLVPIKP